MKTKMVIGALGALLGSAWGAQAGPWESIESLPKQKPVVVLVKDRARHYFRITPQSPLVVPIEGPARLRVVSRAELPSGDPRSVSYRLRALEGSTVLHEQRTESSTAPHVRLTGARAAIGKSRRMVIDVPSGRHEVTLTVEGVPAVVVRLKRGTPMAGREDMVTLTPIDAARSVTVTEGQKTIPYHTTYAGKPVRLRVVGPSRLDLTLRLDFDATMRGAHAYRVAVTDNGRSLRELAFRTTKSTTASFTNQPDRIPSKFDQARIEIPPGPHDLAIELIQPRNGAAEVHARIPQPTAGVRP